MPKTPVTRTLHCLAMLALTLALSGCGDATADLVGSWTQVAGSAPQSVLVLNEDGTGRFQPRGGVEYQIDQWVVRADYLELDIPGYKLVGQFKLGDQLEMSGIEGFEEFNGRYRRQ